MSWIISQALMNSLCSQGLEVEFLEENCLDGEQSVQLNGKPIQQAYCAPDKMTDFSHLSRFGMMFKPLTESRGEELLMLYREGFPVKIYQPLEKAQGLMEKDQECGNTWRGWLAKFDPDSCSWKTAQCSLLEGEQESLQTLPKWGITRHGLLWEQPMLEQITKGTESGFLEKWATPTTMDKLPPKSLKALEKEATQARPGRTKPANLRDQVANTENWNKLLPTPNARDWKDGKTAGNRKSPGLGVIAHQLDNQNGGHLNPMWVEWLMGWPLGWTELKPLEMDKCHFVRQLHFCS